ncbi:MAG: TolC family protein [Gemmatimonadota bacterium]
MALVAGLSAALLGAPALGAQEVTLGGGAGPAMTLEEALRIALANNPSIESADASYASAKAARWADYGAFLPRVSVSGAASRTSFTNSSFLSPEGSPQILDPPLEDVSKSNSASLTLSLPLFSPERFSDAKAGGAELGAARLRLSAAEATVVRDVRRAYLEALKQQRLLEVADRQQIARGQDLEVTESRYRIAAASRSDLLGAQIDLSDAELRYLDADAGLAAALRDLHVLLARPSQGFESTDAVLVDIEEVPDASGLDPAELASAAMRANPTVLALEQDERAASAGLLSAKAAWLPSVDVSLTFGRSRSLAESQSLFSFDPANTRATFSISGSWTLFDNFSRKASNAQANRSLRQARADLTRERLNLERDVRDLVSDLQRRHRRLDALTRNQELADERLELAREQYRLGSIPYFNLQQAIDRLNSAEQSLFQDRYEYLKAWADLEERLGRAAR